MINGQLTTFSERGMHMKKRVKKVSLKLNRIRVKREISRLEPLMEMSRQCEQESGYAPLLRLGEDYRRLFRALKQGKRSAASSLEAPFDRRLYSNIARVLADTDGRYRQIALESLALYSTVSWRIQIKLVEGHRNGGRVVEGWQFHKSIFFASAKLAERR